MPSSVLLMTPVQILFRTSAQKMYGRSHEQSVSPSGTAGKGWGNPRAEMSEQCCHHYGHYYSRFTCQLQLMQLQQSSKFYERDKCPVERCVSTQSCINKYTHTLLLPTRKTETTSMETRVWSSVGMTRYKHKCVKE
jgi:hypothetical protein